MAGLLISVKAIRGTHLRANLCQMRFRKQIHPHRMENLSAEIPMPKRLRKGGEEIALWI